MSVATLAASTVNCRRCDEPISTRAKPGNTIRCPSCGYAQRLRAPGQVAQLRQDAPAGAWNPPSEPRGTAESADPCPRCGGAALASPRGTVRACPGCRVRVTPPAVLAPYRRDSTTAARQVKSQRERDLEALSLARRKGVMLAELAALAADDRLDPASVPVIEWFRERVKDAASDGRLDELAALLPEADIRRRHRWQGQPAALTAGYGDEDDDPDDREDGDEDQADEDGAPLATPASIAAQQWRATVDYDAELAAREWIWKPHGAGLCHLIHMKPHGWDIPPEECLGRAEHALPGGAVCGSCYYALNTPLGGRGRR